MAPVEQETLTDQEKINLKLAYEQARSAEAKFLGSLNRLQQAIDDAELPADADDLDRVETVLQSYLVIK